MTLLSYSDTKFFLIKYKYLVKFCVVREFKIHEILHGLVTNRSSFFVIDDNKNVNRTQGERSNIRDIFRDDQNKFRWTSYRPCGLHKFFIDDLLTSHLKHDFYVPVCVESCYRPMKVA